MINELGKVDYRVLDEALKDFEKASDVDEKLIQEYREKLPEEVLGVWEKYGFGTFMNGYLKVINPNDYIQLLKDSYFQGNKSIAIFATAFGDVIAWRENHFLDIIYYRYGKEDVMLASMKNFFNLLIDEPEEFIDDFFTIKKYNKAVEMHGPLSYDECFGYVPILALGGKETAKNLKKVKIREHIALITALIGEI